MKKCYLTLPWNKCWKRHLFGFRNSLAPSLTQLEHTTPLALMQHTLTKARNNLTKIHWFSLPFRQFQTLLTLFPKSFSSFPHGTCLLLVSNLYLALDEVYHPLCTPIPRKKPQFHCWAHPCTFAITDGILFKFLSNAYLHADKINTCLEHTTKIHACFSTDEDLSLKKSEKILNHFNGLLRPSMLVQLFLHGGDLDARIANTGELVLHELGRRLNLDLLESRPSWLQRDPHNA